ncbi:MAG: bifunctional 23S rRNA (guanine(2069)-N(7))-methyltransferase RlmK/23S rRNA (guanine(2445)-N(2))-methyltransferase RlmL [Atopobiaceae bacterium]|nr:bifunctional 23S rRNA (guanine(2069)-N(7))-methyltransferase RlmK/23S rRNA (guanine(2445)-N(2))-methyltransferase RlmL [Atopobiaceae bacterium]
MEFFARCAGGFEDVLARELRTLGMRRVRPQVGGVIFFGALEDAYRACLWLRSATRVQLVLARVAATDADELYQGVAALPWERHVPPEATIAVDAHGENPELRNTKFIALKVKDAVCDHLRDVRGARPDVDAKDPDLSINVAVHPRKATVYLNLSGASLHRRGYRQEGVQTEAPLKETLAAGILLAAGWDRIAAKGGCLADPMCGSGTFSIEAALMLADAAPGLLRQRWGFEGWLGHDRDLWERVRGQALERRRSVRGVRIIAGDLSEAAVRIARANASRAGVADLISFKVDDAANLARRMRELRGAGDVPGLMVANPPYGQRLLSQGELPEVNAALSAAADAIPASWGIAIVSPDLAVDTALGRVPQEVIDCYNGPIRVWTRLYGDGTERQVQHIVSLAGQDRTVSVADENSGQFAARLRKVAKERAKWARKAHVECYRVYDADLPDYAVAIDLFQGSGQNEGERHFVIEERRRPASVDLQRAARRFADAVALSGAVLDIPATHVIARPWQQRQRGEQARLARTPLTISEGACRFEVDLARSGAGQFLAHRSVRSLAGSLAEGRRVAALFATSGLALVNAAMAGATSTVIVDGSKEWLGEAVGQLRENGLAGKTHRQACEDVRMWLAREAAAHRSYDLVICEAPAWLPARDAGGRDWDLSRDCLRLLCAAGKVLSADGVMLLAYDDPNVRLDYDALERAGLTPENVSGRAVPHDFERSRNAPRCYLIRRRR